MPYFDQTTDLVVTPESGRALAKTLGDATAVVMKNHGIAVVGETIEIATVRAYLLEKALKIFYIAKGFGELTWSSDDDVKQKIAKAYSAPKLNHMWEALSRQLAKKERQEQILEMLAQKM